MSTWTFKKPELLMSQHLSWCVSYISASSTLELVYELRICKFDTHADSNNFIGDNPETDSNQNPGKQITGSRYQENSTSKRTKDNSICLHYHGILPPILSCISAALSSFIFSTIWSIF